MLRVVNRIHQQCVQFVYFAVSFGAYLLSLIQSVRVRPSIHFIFATAKAKRMDQGRTQPLDEKGGYSYMKSKIDISKFSILLNGKSTSAVKFDSNWTWTLLSPPPPSFPVGTFSPYQSLPPPLPFLVTGQAK